MSRSERDLVTALRDELAAIDPSRPCDRRRRGGRARARSRPVGKRPSARLAHRLRRSGEGQAAEVPFAWSTAAEHCRIAWLRGRFLVRGSLSLAGGRTHLEFVVAAGRGARPGGRLADFGLAGLVADPARPRRRDLEERRGGRARSCAASARRGAARGRGAAGLAGAARRAQPGPQRRVGQPPARGQRRRPAARRDRHARGRRAAGRAAVRRPAGRRRRAARRPRRAWRSSPSGSSSIARRSSGRSSGSSGWRRLEPARRRAVRPWRHRSVMIRVDA